MSTHVEGEAVPEAQGEHVPTIERIYLALRFGGGAHLVPGVAVGAQGSRRLSRKAAARANSQNRR